MHVNRLVLVSMFVSLSGWLVAQEAPSQSGTLRERAIKQFDKDGDGKLSPSERALRGRLFFREATRPST